MPLKVQKLFAYLSNKVQPLKKYFGRFPSAAKKLTSEFSPADEAYIPVVQKWLTDRSGPSPNTEI